MSITKYDLFKSTVFDATVAPFIGGDYTGSSAIVDAVNSGKRKLLIRPGTYDISSMSSYPSGLIMFGIGLDSEFTLTGQTPQTPFFTLESTKPIKNNFEASANPTTDTDESLGYQVGSTWINISTDEAYLCVDSTISGASWIGSTAELHSELNGLGADDHTQYHLTDGTRPITGPIVSTGGNARGTNAIDLQLTRTLATEVASGANSFIGSGRRNTANGQSSGVVSGDDNAAGYASFVGGGDGNAANADNGGWSAIAGGESNSTSGNVRWSFIGSGGTNTIITTGNSYYNAIVGGNSNTMTNAEASTIAGGESITMTAGWSFIGGGYQNDITESYGSCTIAGGENNSITDGGKISFIGGGDLNESGGEYSVIGGGKSNSITTSSSSYLSRYDTIVGGWANSIYAGTKHINYNFIGGGRSNGIANIDSSAIISGYNNDIFGLAGGDHDDCVIAGGRNNIIRLLDGSSNFGQSFIGSGWGNIIEFNGFESEHIGDSIVGGHTNKISQSYPFHFSGGGEPSFIGGGKLNLIDSTYGFQFIGGGYGNNITGTDTYTRYNTIGGGADNVIDSCKSAVIAGGAGNSIIDGDWSAILGGDDHSVSGWENAVVCGYGNSIIDLNSYANVIVSGDDNIIAGTASTQYSFIGNGSANIIDGAIDYASIVNGTNNNVKSTYGFIGSGNTNIIDINSTYSIITGGQINTVSGTHIVIAGGYDNNVSANWGAIGGGRNNSISTSNGQYSTIAGGSSNLISGLSQYNTIGGGDSNVISCTDQWNTIGGGQNNVITGDHPYNVIAGGVDNLINDTYPSDSHGRHFIGSGDTNIISGTTLWESSIVGGWHNEILGGDGGFIGGGWENVINDGDTNFIGSGNANIITTGDWVVIVGGDGNSTSGSGSFIGGGHNHSITTENQWYTSIVGGDSNQITGNDGRYSVITGGRTNSIEGSDSRYSFIGTGVNNYIAGTSNQFASIINGDNCYIIGTSNSHSTILGGNQITISSTNSMAYGSYANIDVGADRTVAIVHGDVTTSGITTPDAFILYGKSGQEKKVGIQTLTPNTTLDVNGGTSMPTRTVTAAGNTSATINDYTIRCDATNGNQIIDLPTAASAYNSTDGTGLIINIKKVDATTNKVTIDGSTTELVEFDETQELLNRGESLTLQSNGTSWDII